MDGHQSSLIFALSHMTLEGKITMSILGAMSLASWAVIIHKLLSIWKQRRASHRFHGVFARTDDPRSLLEREKEFGAAPSFLAFETIYEELESMRERLRAKLLPRKALAQFKSLVSRAENEEAVRMESGTVVLALAISGGPFIGLTGTVFGVMETFSGVAQAGQADLSAMAPGVAGALVNTILGLIVAIPALFAYNMITKSIQSLQMAMSGFLADVTARVEAEDFAEDGGAAPAAAAPAAPGSAARGSESEAAAAAAAPRMPAAPPAHAAAAAAAATSEDERIEREHLDREIFEGDIGDLPEDAPAPRARRRFSGSRFAADAQ